MTDYYSQKIAEVIKSLKTSEKGLTAAEAAKRLEEYGYNELEKGKKLSILAIFFNQFKNALLLLLIIVPFTRAGGCTFRPLWTSALPTLD